jgi:hypothetical protein
MHGESRDDKTETSCDWSRRSGDLCRADTLLQAVREVARRRGADTYSNVYGLPIHWTSLLITVGVAAYKAVLPPLMWTISPVMKLALFDARNMMTWAISSGVPMRFSGTP